MMKRLPVSNVSFPLAELVAGLRAAGEDTRVRILALLVEGELTVSDLTDILGQSQPRISRHLKLMVEAGLVERSREGAWAFFRIPERTAAAHLARMLAEQIDPADTIIAADKSRLGAVRMARAKTAEAFFNRHAAEWDRIRSLHAPDDVVEAAMKRMIGDDPLVNVLDLGTGTGRILEVFGAQAERVVGIDSSHAMLAVARANLERAVLKRVELRQGDIYALPTESDAFDLVIVHQVLHFLDDPARALKEAKKALAPGGRLLVVDFAPHELEFLRETQAHRRLGFSMGQMTQWLVEAGLDAVGHVDIAPPDASDKELTVSLFLARDRRQSLLRATIETGREVA